MVKGLAKENDPTPVAPEVAAPAKKDRHVVTWTPQEDDLLREHIALHGIDNWTSIAALFKDKSSRQCRRRWNTYLNSECKKGGWSAEEDMILCEAQKMFGNRWTEIAKVVPGRTDNAVKNRFSTLCKKRSTIEVSSKENRVPSLDPSTKRVLVGEPSVAIVVGEPSTSNKQMRYHISPLKNTSEAHKTSLGENGPAQHLQKSPLLAVQVFHTANPSLASNKVIQATFLRKDDPKLTALLPQAELPTSLSEKVNAENNNQSLDEAWKELQAYLIQTEDSGLLRKMFSGMSCRLDELRGLIDDLHNSSKEEQQPLRQVGSHENSQGSSECSTSSMHNVNAGQSRSDLQFMDCSLHKDNEVNHPNVDAACSNMHSYPESNLSFSGLSKDEDGATTSEFASPLQTIPFSHSFANEIPTPVFTSSERHFLLSLIDLPTPANDNNSKIPSCKRALLDTFKPS
ncbi:transcription factor MYB124-like [Curcuma longa]|uniref:transcription factor MYB124-like n=1 Tax=Curcuma longa TaxID=136217 RepID=UPI003D9E8446